MEQAHLWHLEPCSRRADHAYAKAQARISIRRLQGTRAPGLSIYGIAGVLGMQYQRAHEHAQDLIQAGLVLIKPTVRNGRLSNLLFPRGLETQ